MKDSHGFSLETMNCVIHNDQPCSAWHGHVHASHNLGERDTQILAGFCCSEPPKYIPEPPEGTVTCGPGCYGPWIRQMGAVVK